MIWVLKLDLLNQKRGTLVGLIVMIKCMLIEIITKVPKVKKFGSDLSKIQLGISQISCRQRQVQILMWQIPSLGWAKRNVDGSCLGKPCSFGGVGVLLATFSTHYSHGTNSQSHGCPRWLEFFFFFSFFR